MLDKYQVLCFTFISEPHLFPSSEVIFVAFAAWGHYDPYLSGYHLHQHLSLPLNEVVNYHQKIFYINNFELNFKVVIISLNSSLIDILYAVNVISFSPV